MTDGGKLRIILHQVAVLRLVSPVYRIDRVGLVVAVLNALLVAIKLLAIEDERNALRCIYRCLGKLHHSQAFLLRSICCFLKTVAKTMVIVAAHIADMLERIAGPALDCHLRMLDSTSDAELDVLLIACDAVHESGILASERTAHGITDIIAECADPVKHVCILLESYLLSRVCRRLGSPALAVDHDIRIYSMETLADFIHGINVMDSHEVETESIDVIFLHPPLERLDHVLAEHLLLRSSLIAASGTVKEGSVLAHAIEIALHGTLEACIRRIGGMVVNNIKNNAEAGLVKSLYHLLEFLDAGYRIVWICRERALDSIVVERLVSPVVLVVLQTGLVNGREVCRRKQLDICHTQLLEMVDARRKSVRILCALFSESKILSLIAYTGSLVDREIPVLKFVYDDVGRLDFRTPVLSPAFRICLSPVDHSSAHAVDSDSLCGDTGSLLQKLTVLLHLERIECTFDILLHYRLPKTVFRLLHVHDLECGLI